MKSYITTASTFAASYTPDVQDSTRIATDRILNSRKTWKTLKANNECVWSPEIEAALIEGLEKYRPASMTDPLTLKRFPKRNRWISEHIRQVTGKVRSPKQVGSRLQQLRDTCRDDRILRLLSRRQYTPEPETPVSSDKGSSFSSPPTVSPLYMPLDSSRARESASGNEHMASDVQRRDQRSRGKLPTSASPTHTSVYIELNPQSTTHQLCPHVSSPNSGRSSLSQDQIHEKNSRSIPSTYARLPVIDTSTKEVTVYSANLLANTTAPTVSFTSPLILTTSDFVSCFQVSLSGSIMHTELTELLFESSSRRGSDANVEYSHLYVSNFAPQFWKQLCLLEPEQICQYSIMQHIGRRDFTRCDAQGEMRDILLSLSYHFRSPMAPLKPSLSPPPPLKEESPIISLSQLSKSQREDRHQASGTRAQQPADVSDDYDDTPLVYPYAEETSSHHQLVASSGAPEDGCCSAEQSEFHVVHPYENSSAILLDDGYHQQQQVSYAGHHPIPVLRRSHSPDSLGLDPPMREYPSSIPPPGLILPLNTNGHEIYMVPTINLGAGMPSYFWDHSQSFHVSNHTQVVSGYTATDTIAGCEYNPVSASSTSAPVHQYMDGAAQAQQYHSSSNAAEVPPSPYETQVAWMNSHESEYRQPSSRGSAYSTTCM